MRSLAGGRSRARRGGVLVEFALVAFALYLVTAAMMGFGRWMFVVQAAQDTARVAARELALYPLPAASTVEGALAAPGFAQAVYDPGFLVVDLDVNPPGPLLDQAFATMPVVNRALRPLMITSSVDVEGTIRRVLHMPGMLVASPSGPSGLTVLVPRIDSRDPESGVETDISLVPVLEEIVPGAFSVLSPDGGLVGLRLNVPYQSATFSAYVPSSELTPQGDPFNTPVVASNLLGGGFEILGSGPDGSGPYAGRYGLGRQFALGLRLRPFRRLVTAQALFRREVFQ